MYSSAILTSRIPRGFSDLGPDSALVITPSTSTIPTHPLHPPRTHRRPASVVGISCRTQQGPAGIGCRALGVSLSALRTHPRPVRDHAGCRSDRAHALCLRPEPSGAPRYLCCTGGQKRHCGRTQSATFWRGACLSPAFPHASFPCEKQREVDSSPEMSNE